jgi:hypothetical protein
MFELYTTVRSFMTLRVEGSGAEALLSDDAADQYANAQGGLSLYGYAEHAAFQIEALNPGEDDSVVALVHVVTPESGDILASELLTVGDHDPEDGRAEILAAERTLFDQVRAFVRRFLEARRLASGAGTYLGEDAREAYASHENGLDLLGYAASERVGSARMVQYDKVSPERHQVGVLFVSRPAPGEPGPTRIYETLTIEPLDDGFVVADAERGRPG